MKKFFMAALVFGLMFSFCLPAFAAEKSKMFHGKDVINKAKIGKVMKGGNVVRADKVPNVTKMASISRGTILPELDVYISAENREAIVEFDVYSGDVEFHSVGAYMHDGKKVIFMGTAYPEYNKPNMTNKTSTKMVKTSSVGTWSQIEFDERKEEQILDVRVIPTESVKVLPVYFKFDIPAFVTRRGEMTCSQGGGVTIDFPIMSLYDFSPPNGTVADIEISYGRVVASPVLKDDGNGGQVVKVSFTAQDMADILTAQGEDNDTNISITILGENFSTLVYFWDPCSD